MHIKDTVLYNNVQKVHKTQGGKLYVFDNFLLSEFDSGTTVNYENISEIYNYLDIYSKENTSFGYLSNRINSYAVNVGDFIKARKLANKKYPMAVVTYTKKNKGIFLFEKQLYKCNAEHFSGIREAVQWLNSFSYSLN